MPAGRNEEAMIVEARASGSGPTPTRWAEAGLLAWGLSLVGAFLLFHPELASLPAQLLSQAASPRAGSAVALPGLLRSLGGLALAAGLALAWYGAGDLVVRLATGASGRGPRALDLGERFVVGAATWSLLWLGLGALHLYRPLVAVVALSLGLTLAAVAWVRTPGGGRRPGRLDGPGRVALALCTGVLVLALLAALAPPTAKDTLLYHLAVPKAYVRAGSGVEVFHNVASYYPLGVEMQAVWALLLGGLGPPHVGEAAAGAITFAFAPLLLAIVYGWARERGLDRGWAMIAALAIAGIPTTYHVAASVYVDLALAAYMALVMRAAGRWWTTLRAEWLARLALALGAALCIKLTAGFVVAPLAALIALRAWLAGRRTAPAARIRAAARLTAGGLAGLAVAGVIAGPWYVRNWIRTGSPFFPFYVDVFGGRAPGWDLERSYQYEALFAHYGGGERGLLAHLLAPLRLAVAGQLEQPALYDGVLGVTLLVGLPLVIWALARRRIDAELRMAMGLSAVLFIAWLFASQQLRYLLPAAPGWVLGMVAAVAAWCASERQRARVAWLLTASAAAGLAVSLAWFIEQRPVAVVLGGEPREQYLARRLDYYPYYELVNRELPDTARVWLIDMRRDTYHLERPYVGDFMFEDWTLRQWVQAARDAGAVRARARAAGITHVLVRHDLLFDYDRSVIVDDRKPREENLARLALMRAFFQEGTRLVRGDDRFWLIELGRP